MFNLNKKGVSPVIAIVLLLMMTVAAAGAAYFWLTSMQSKMQKASYKSIEKVMESTGRRVTAQATLCKPTYPYKGLKGYWMMEEGSGNKTYDKSGNENTGTLYPGPNTEIDTDTEMWTDGQIEKALKFDGNDSYVDCGNDSSLSDLSAFTITAWVNLHFPSIYDNPKQDGIAAKGGEWGFRVTNGKSRLGFALYGQSASTGFKVPPYEWVHLVGIVSEDQGEVVFYMNGKNRESYELTTTIDPATDPFEMGNGANGTIDELRIYSRALSENEIQELYDAENHSARRRIDVTVRNIGSEEIPKATWVANLKHDGTNVETDAYNASSIDTGELATLKFYFKNFKPNTGYKIELQGTGTSTTVSC